MPRINPSRSKLGRFLDKKGYSQSKLARQTGLNKNTITKVFIDSTYIPSGQTIKRIMNVLKNIDPNSKAEDFFDI